MFNRQPFNRGKYNTAFSALTEAGGVANMALTGTAAAFLSIQTSASTAILDFDINAKPTRNIQPPTTMVRLSLNATGQNRKRLLGNPEIAKLDMEINADMTRRMFSEIFANLVMGIDGIGTRKITVNAPNARLILGLTAASSRIIRAVLPAIPININANGRGIRSLFANAPETKLSLEVLGMAEMYGYAVLDLEGLILPIGGNLIIDTGEMTVTLNGQDVTRYVSRNSEFFKLRPGDNVILYEDGVQSRNISYNILWKNLWL